MPTEAMIRKTLRRLARQRVALVLQPGNVWVVERAIGHDPDIEAALRTCHMRGWVEPVDNAVPRANLTPDGQLPDTLDPQTVAPMYRLTEAGWHIINRAQLWITATFVVALATLVATILGILIARSI